MFKEIVNAFVKGLHGCTPRRHVNRKAQKIREQLSERQIDRMVEDSFPASDAPSTY